MMTQDVQIAGIIITELLNSFKGRMTKPIKDGRRVSIVLSDVSKMEPE